MRPGRLTPALLTVAHHAGLVLLGALFLAPIAFIVLTALMTEQQALTGDLWPRPFRWSSFADVLDRAPLLRYAWNTTQIAVLSTIGIVVSSVPVAYALSHLRWRGRQAVLVAVLAVFMLPEQVTVVPLYAIYAELGWIGTLKPLIVPSFFGSAFSIFLLRQFFLTIPQTLTDAARVEGAGELRVLLRVVVPLARPAIAAVALLHALFVWNDLFHPLLFLGQRRDLWTVSLALSEFRGIYDVDWSATMAASVLITLPVLAVLVAAQRALVDGVALAGKVA